MKTRLAYRGYAILVSLVGKTFSVAIERLKPEVPLVGRRTMHRLASADEALRKAKAKIDALLKG